MYKVYESVTRSGLKGDRKPLEFIDDRFGRARQGLLRVPAVINKPITPTVQEGGGI